MIAKRKSPGVLALILAAVLLLSSGLQATIVRYIPFEEQCSSAGVIVVARVSGRTSAWDEGGRSIYTDSELQVDETLKGESQSRLTVRQLGGTVGELSQSVAGTPVLSPGRLYVLFLEPRGDGRYRVVGFSQGCYPVLEDRQGKARVAPQMSASGGAELLGKPAARTEGNLSLAEFLARIRINLSKDGK